MSDELFRRILLHIESAKFVITDLETTVRLAMQLGESLDVPDTTDEAIAEILQYFGEIEKAIEKSRCRYNKLAQMFHREVEFAEAERVK